MPDRLNTNLIKVKTTTTTTTFIIFTIDKIKVYTQPAVSNS